MTVCTMWCLNVAELCLVKVVADWKLVVYRQQRYLSLVRWKGTGVLGDWCCSLAGIMSLVTAILLCGTVWQDLGHKYWRGSSHYGDSR